MGAWKERGEEVLVQVIMVEVHSPRSFSARRYALVRWMTFFPLLFSSSWIYGSRRYIGREFLRELFFYVFTQQFSLKVYYIFK